MVPIRLDGRPAATGGPGISSQDTVVAQRITARIRAVARSRISVAELALLVVLGGLTASLSVAVLT